MDSLDVPGDAGQPQPTVLLVEDDEIQRVGMEAMLSFAGFQVLCCASGEQARAQFAKHPCEVAVLDLLLPDTDGVALSDELRSLDPHLGVVVVTMYPGVQSAVNAMRHGAVDFIAKPVNPDQLVIAVRIALTRREAERQNKIQQLAVAEKLDSLQTVNAQLNEFAARVAHDLRSPVRAASLWIEFAREAIARSEPAEADRYLESAVKAIASGAHIIDGLLALSKSSQLPIRPKHISLAPLIQSIVESCRVEFRAARYRVQISVNETVLADPVLVGIAMSNVVHNAFKYASTRSDPAIEITARPADQHHYVVQVRDNGIGISPDQMDRLFVPFERLSSAPAFAGEGIGLTTVKQVMNKHGGTVTLHSKPDEGTTVELRFPLDLSPDDGSNT